MPDDVDALLTPTLAHGWHLFTRLGEAQILLPAAALVVLHLWRQPEGPALLRRWLGGLAAAVLLTTASKVAFIGWGLGSAALDYTGISGHAMFAAAVHPLLLGALVPGDRPRARRAAVLLGALLALGVGVSRVVVQAHSWSEVIAGLLLGGAVGSVALGLGQLHLRVPLWPAPLLLAWLASTATLAPPSPTHSMVTRLALAVSGHARPCTRADLHTARGAQRAPGCAAGFGVAGVDAVPGAGDSGTRPPG